MKKLICLVVFWLFVIPALGQVFAESNQDQQSSGVQSQSLSNETVARGFYHPPVYHPPPRHDRYYHYEPRPAVLGCAPVF